MTDDILGTPVRGSVDRPNFLRGGSKCEKEADLWR
jgi:hypothetical protein